MGSASAAANTASLITVVPVSSTKLDIHDKFSYGFHLRRGRSIAKFTAAISPNGSVSPSSSHGAGCSAGDADKQRCSLESLFCYDKSTGRENREAYWDIFVPLVLVQACMLIQYWRGRVLLSKFAAPVAGEVATLCVQNVVAAGI
ncbi:unnamed protein product [Malus baccata var. baccata]